jgi:Bacterial Ig domain
VRLHLDDVRSALIGICIFIICGSTGHGQQSSSTIVLWTANVSAVDIHGDFARAADSTAAGGFALWNPDRGSATLAPALAEPTTYFELKFTATQGVPYHLWLRLKAQNDGVANDSVHVQFSDSTDAAGTPISRIGTSDSQELILQDGTRGATPLGWGWADNAYGGLGLPIYFATTGTHVLRIQQREDGVMIDQAVLSPDIYSSTPPGAVRNDTTVLPAAGAVLAGPMPGTSVVWTANISGSQIFGNWQRVSDSTAAGAAALQNPDAGVSKISPALASPVNYFEATISANAGIPYHVWVRMRAQRDSTLNDSIHMQFNDSVTDAGSPAARIGTTDSTEFVLQRGPSAPAPHGWGWTDNGWGTPGTPIYFATSGTHTLRVQQREDGASVDQIVISSDAYLTTAPGAAQDDGTLLSAASVATNQSRADSLTAPASGPNATATTLTVDNTDAAASGSGWSSSTSYPNYVGVDYLYSANTAGSRFTWRGTNLATGTYDVFAWWPATTSGRPTDVSYEIATATGVTTVTGVNQNLNGGTWRRLATVANPTAVTVISGATGSEGTVADAVRFVASTANQPPSVALTAPANNATFAAPATMNLVATAADPENRMARVEFYSGSTLLGSDTTSPYSYSSASVPAGTYTLTAVAFDQDGNQTRSAPVTVTVSGATTSTRTLVFTASADNDTNVTSYRLNVFASTANPATATPVATISLGKPTPDANRQISVNESTFINALAGGNYLATVTAIGPGGQTQSAAYAFTR